MIAHDGLCGAVGDRNIFLSLDASDKVIAVDYVYYTLWQICVINPRNDHVNSRVVLINSACVSHFDMHEETGVFLTEFE